MIATPGALRGLPARPGRAALAPLIVTGLAFGLLFWDSMTTLASDWWSNPDAGHGLLLAPLAVYLAYSRGRVSGFRSRPVVGLALVLFALLLHYGSVLAAELFTMRISMLIAGAGLVVYAWGGRQLLHWWLPALLLVLSVPLPAVVLETMALPLQLQASRMGAALLESRHVPVYLAGNVLHLPGHSLFVTEACSGLRSLTALLSLALLIGGMWLRWPVTRALLVAAAIPVAVLLNGIRVFLTGFLVYYVDPRLGEGLLHYTEGWVIFAIAFAILGGIARVLYGAENLLANRDEQVEAVGTGGAPDAGRRDDDGRGAEPEDGPVAGAPGKRHPRRDRRASRPRSKALR